ncbi:MAG TPA: hypothetical protein VHQ45_13335, partial [Gemmatimonadaceae bacterium]|nr:hypothetical protein [Gemmatimonadaceae bacterium]
MILVVRAVRPGLAARDGGGATRSALHSASHSVPSSHRRTQYAPIGARGAKRVDQDEHARTAARIGARKAATHTSLRVRAEWMRVMKPWSSAPRPLGGRGCGPGDSGHASAAPVEWLPEVMSISPSAVRRESVTPNHDEDTRDEDTREDHRGNRR